MNGVYEVYQNQFTIGVGGRNSTAEQMLPIADLENFSVSIDNTREEWNAMENGGWGSGMITGKKMTISLKGKRNIGDPGNDYVAGLWMAKGKAAKSVLNWNFPDGTVVHIPVDISVTNNGTGDTTNVAPLEFECASDGKPTVELPGADAGEEEGE